MPAPSATEGSILAPGLFASRFGKYLESQWNVRPGQEQEQQTLSGLMNQPMMGAPGGGVAPSNLLNTSYQANANPANAQISQNMLQNQMGLSDMFNQVGSLMSNGYQDLLKYQAGLLNLDTNQSQGELGAFGL